MPELPEVEHARRQLESHLASGLHSVSSDDVRIVRHQPTDVFSNRLRNVGFSKINRVGKQLLCVTSGGPVLGLHLGMTGQLVLSERGPDVPHSRLRFIGPAATLHLVDPRRFARAHVGSQGEVEATFGIEKLGPDALALSSDQNAFDLTWLRASAGSSRSVKTQLMDQSWAAGVGNIHAVEACFLSGLLPSRRASSLTKAERHSLSQGLLKTFELALAHLASGPVIYVNQGGPNLFSVYGREGEPCVRCTKPILRRVDAGRSTYFCAGCQR